MAPILLKRVLAIQEFDQAGVMAEKRTWPSYNPGYYTHKLLPLHMKPPDTLDYVPPLQYFCLKSLYSRVDSIEMGDISRFSFYPDAHIPWLKALVPFFTSHMSGGDLKYVDPRLWGTLIQLYSMLPPCFQTYTLPLSDIHLSQLQAIQSTPDFTLITVLDLSSCRDLTDETIGELKPLTNLCVLDLSLTRVGSWGARKLSMCLVQNRDGRIGPWRLRIWSLRGCKNIDDTVKDTLARFPLLSAVDLRDTSVTPYFHLPGYTSRPPSTHTTFYYPNPPLSWIDGLCGSFPGCRIFQSSATDSLHVIHINKLEYPKILPPNRFRDETNNKSSTGGHDRILAFFSNKKNPSHTIHDLSQDLQQGDSIATEQTRKRMRQHNHAYEPRDTYHPSCDHIDDVGGSQYDGFSENGPWSDDSLDDHADHDRSIDDHSDRSFSDDDHSPGDLTRGICSETAASKHLQGPFGARRAETPFDVDPHTCREQSMRELFEATAEHNEVAALVIGRHAAEQEASRFYSRPNRPDLGGARRLLSRGDDQATGVLFQKVTKQLQGPVEQIPPRGRQWGLMFFRKPPGYDSIINDGAPEPGQLHKKKPDESIVAKKRKAEGRPVVGVPKALFIRHATKGQGIETGEMGVEYSQNGNKSFGGKTAEKSHSCQPTPSNNPFLAKMKPGVRSPSTSKLVDPTTPYCHNDTLSKQPSTAMVPWTASNSRRQSQTSLEVSIKPVMFTAPGGSASCTEQPEATRSSASTRMGIRPTLDREEILVKTKTRKDTFDMRAWVMQTNI